MGLLERAEDHLDDPVTLGEHVTVGEPQNSEPLTSEPVIPLRVSDSLLIEVVSTVDLDD